MGHQCALSLIDQGARCQVGELENIVKKPLRSRRLFPYMSSPNPGGGAGDNQFVEVFWKKNHPSWRIFSRTTEMLDLKPHSFFRKFDGASNARIFEAIRSLGGEKIKKYRFSIGSVEGHFTGKLPEIGRWHRHHSAGGVRFSFLNVVWGVLFSKTVSKVMLGTKLCFWKKQENEAYGRHFWGNDGDPIKVGIKWIARR